MSLKSFKTIYSLNSFFWACCLMLIAGGLWAEPKPKPILEVGIGAGLITIPDYRGSSERQVYGLPIPYVIYRGDRFKVGRSGITGELFKDSRWELDLSANASPPANSDDNAVRAGMPDLSPTIELGPKLKYHLGKPAPGMELTLNLPVRAVISIDGSDIEQIGWLAQPNLNLYARDFYHSWNLGLQAGVLFGDSEYHNYFYGVSNQFATASRPAFDADGGYSGTALLSSLSKRFDRYWVGGFLRYDNLSGVAFEGSPLLEKKHSFMAGVGFAWIFYQSKEVTTNRLEGE